MPIQNLSIRRRKIANKLFDKQKFMELDERSKDKKKQINRRARGK
jgi:hypothetical protein